MQAEKKSEQKRRGNKETQTSDAKFDEQFKLGHQMAAQVCRTVMQHFLVLRRAWSSCCIFLLESTSSQPHPPPRPPACARPK